MVIWKLEQKYIVVNLVEKYIVKDVAQHHTALIVTHLQTASGLQVLVNISKATLFGSPFVVIGNLGRLGRLKRLGIFQKEIAKFIKFSNFPKLPNQKT